MRIDCHMHTPLCGHAVGEPEEYVREAAKRGIELITFTCHIPMDRGFGGPGIRMNSRQLPDYFTAIKQAAVEGEKCNVNVLTGIEAEVFPDAGIMDEMDEIIERCDFDFILGSLHHPLAEYRAWLKQNQITSEQDIINTYFRHLTEGVQSGRYHSMSHPDVIRIYGTVNRCELCEHEDVIRGFLEALCENDVCMEVNTSGLTKGVFQVHPDPLIMGWAAEMGVKLTIGSDAHRPECVGQKFEEVIPVLKNKGFSEVHYFQKGKRISTTL